MPGDLSIQLINAGGSRIKSIQINQYRCATPTVCEIWMKLVANADAHSLIKYASCIDAQAEYR